MDTLTPPVQQKVVLQQKPGLSALVAGPNPAHVHIKPSPVSLIVSFATLPSISCLPRFFVSQNLMPPPFFYAAD